MGPVDRPTVSSGFRRRERAVNGSFATFYAPPVKLVAFGTEAVGVIAVGQAATGIVAIGQVATGVVAIGQLARGVFVVGQLGLGIVAVGQLAVGVLWAGGMLGVAATSGPGVIGGLFGRLYLRRLFQRRSEPAFPGRWRLRRRRVVMAGVGTVALAALWWVAAGQWLLDDLSRPPAVPVEAPEPPLPCVPLC
jgi:hypothetical protein